MARTLKIPRQPAASGQKLTRCPKCSVTCKRVELSFVRGDLMCPQCACEVLGPVKMESSLPSRTKSFMPFGKYKGVCLADVPTAYLRWSVEECQLKPWLHGAVKTELADRENAANLESLVDGKKTKPHDCHVGTLCCCSRTGGVHAECPLHGERLVCEICDREIALEGGR